MVVSFENMKSKRARKGEKEAEKESVNGEEREHRYEPGEIYDFLDFGY